MIDLKGEGKAEVLNPSDESSLLVIVSMDAVDGVKVGDRYRMPCGHEGRVIHVMEDTPSFCVQGMRRGCATCGKGRSSEWTPTTYVMTQE